MKHSGQRTQGTHSICCLASGSACTRYAVKRANKVSKASLPLEPHLCRYGQHTSAITNMKWCSRNLYQVS